MLMDVIANQEWCLSMDKTNILNKVMITTTKPQLNVTHAWLDENHPEIYTQHIVDKMDVTTLLNLVWQLLKKF